MDSCTWELETGCSVFNVDDRLLSDDGTVAQSRKRCAASRLDPRTAIFAEDMSQAVAIDFLWRNSKDIAAAHDIFTHVGSRLADRDSTLVLTDGQGRILSLYGHEDVTHQLFEKFNFRPTVRIADDLCGTTAVGLSLQQSQPAALRGEQHYCQMFFNWTCVAAPVRGPGGSASACVALAAAHRTPLSEKVALVGLMAELVRKNCHFDGLDDADAPGAAVGNDLATPLFTARQHQILVLFARGLSYKKIASHLGLRSTKTVEEHLDAVRRKLAVSSRRECIQMATRLGLL